MFLSLTQLLLHVIFASAYSLSSSALPVALSYCAWCRLLEELVPFMDHGIDDPKALQMSSSHHRRKQPVPKVCIKVASILRQGESATGMRRKQKSACHPAVM